MRTLTLRRGDGATETPAYDWWRPGEVLRGTAETPLAWDCETERVAGPLHVPRLALAVAYDGERLRLVHPDDLARFILQHRGQHWVGHNVAFDFWVAHQHVGPGFARRALWQLGDAGRLHDTQVLDQLHQLGTGQYRSAGAKGGADTKIYPASLATLAGEYGAVTLDKRARADGDADPYRLRFGELVGLPRDAMDAHPEAAGFYGYALADVVATWQVYPQLRGRCVALMKRAGYSPNAARYEIHPDALGRYGPLSEAIQVRGDIALAHLSRQPLRIDQVRRAELEAETRAAIAAALGAIEAREPRLLQRYSAGARKAAPGSLKYTDATGQPRLNDTVLKGVLAEEAAALGVPVIRSAGKTGGVSTSARDWSRHAGRSPFLAAWCEMERQTKVLQFLVALDAPAVYARYNLLMRTGRTSAGKHTGRTGQDAVPSVNVQQIPRDPRVRSLFVADPGCELFVCDYAYIELRTLAAACRGRFGRSALGDVIGRHAREGGADPHEVMAAALAKMPVEEFMAMPKEARKPLRQNGKACFHPDTEVLTRRGWVRVADVSPDDDVAQYWPGVGLVDYAKPTALTTREGQPLVRVHNEGIDLRVTPDHRMVGFGSTGNPRVVVPADMNLLRGVWNAGVCTAGRRWGALAEQTLRQAVCIQADGSLRGRAVTFGFKKARKIERFMRLFPDAEPRLTSRGVTTFRVPLTGVHRSVLDDRKCFKVAPLLMLTRGMREAFLDEVAHWDSHVNADGLVTYSSQHKQNVDAVQAVAAVTGRKAYASAVGGGRHHLLSIKKHAHTRAGTFAVEPLGGLHTVYCLSMPSSYVVVRDGGKPVCVGQCSFGFPGGLGVEKFRAYAKAQYGVDFTEAEARQAKRVWQGTYPEMRQYLEDRTYDAVAYNLGVDAGVVRRHFPAAGKWSSPLRRLGDALFDNLPADDRDFAALSGLLLNHRPDLHPLLADADGRRRLWSELFLYRACTLTGRVRGRSGHCDGANAPFQGLAADGGKEAVWRLVRDGVDVRAFIHDEVVASVPAADAARHAAGVEKTMVAAMEAVIGHGVPVAVEGRLTPHWTK